MTSERFECFQCWHEERIAEVINREAVSVERATFMATHAPFRSITYLKSPHHISNTSEGELLKELLSRAHNNQHAFVVVQGIPGTGKSHLIRWLKERYAAEMSEEQQAERVLLIERAQNSLIGTLRQIIQSGIFDEQRMHEHLAKLKGATETLSEKALADNILDHLRVATYEVVLDDTERPKKAIAARIERFLLDPVIREELQRPGGPIERLVRFLSIGNSSRTGREELPGFQAADFAFNVETLRKIKNEGGYAETLYLANNLSQREEFRNDLARYLNRLLNYAIGRTTALSVEDLKQIFNDLRRYLRNQGYNLALFIEDITAFTGIDSALVDVLATQHTGESNREFCRLISVIGITDSYFQDRFPDNMRERIGYHLSLNAASKDTAQREESDLLQEQGATADLVARYLNAMRVAQQELETWLANGGRPAELPNPCATCPHKQRCHAAFGTVLLTAEGEPEQAQAGLYPFNAQAIWTMYQHIDTTMTSRTPRSLLHSVLLYVMQSHANTIPEQAFPPPANEMGSEFSPPSLRKPLQRKTIETQGGNDARRIESLVLYWGDGTVDTTGQASERLVGTLSETVFTAFGLPFIDGEKSATSPPVTISTPPAQPTKKAQQSPSPPPQQQVAEPPPPPYQSPEPTPPPPVAQTSKYASDISTWQDGGRLQNYEDLRKFLFNYLSDAIDWEAHTISAAQFNSRLTGRRIEIEGQTGKVQGDCLRFDRSFELAMALQALGDLNDSSLQLNRETIGGHLANLGTWLSQEEERIVAFVRQPHSTIVTHPPLTDLLLYNCLLIEWLCGNLRISNRSVRDLFLAIVKGAATKELTEQQWEHLKERATKAHAATWVKLLKRLNREKVNQCRKNLLQTLNCSQGGSSEVRFIDAATALELISHFKHEEWALPALDFVQEIEAVKDQIWSDTLKISAAFQGFLAEIIAEERQHIQQHMDALHTYMGDSTPRKTLQSIDALIESFKQHQKNHKFTMPRPAGDRTLTNAMNYLQPMLLDETSHEETLLRLSGIADSMKTVQDFMAYFKAFMQEFQDHKKRLEERLTKLRQDDASLEPLRQEVQKRYDQIVQTLHEIEHTPLAEGEEAA